MYLIPNLFLYFQVVVEEVGVAVLVVVVRVVVQVVVVVVEVVGVKEKM
jgi:hypothetical protein